MSSTHLPGADAGYRARVDGWDTVIVLLGAGCWWWNAWSEHTSTELSGTAGTLGEAGVAVRRATTALGAPVGELGEMAARRLRKGPVDIGVA